MMYNNSVKKIIILIVQSLLLIFHINIMKNTSLLYKKLTLSINIYYFPFIWNLVLIIFKQASNKQSRGKKKDNIDNGFLIYIIHI